MGSTWRLAGLALRFAGVLSTAVVRVFWLGSSLAALALSVAMTLSEGVFETFATVVRATTGLATVTAAPEVRYRGGTRQLREAVEDTSRRVSDRVARGAARSIGSAAGEALPVAGIAVVAVATAWDLYDACETMKDLGELAAAIDPERPVDPSSVCGITPPTVAELSQLVISGGKDVLDKAREVLGGGPPSAPAEAQP
jgi:hypothetical protein